MRRTSSAGFADVTGAHYTGRAVGKPRLLLRPRTHVQIQSHMQTEPYDQKPSGLDLKSSSDGYLFHVKQSTGNLHIVPLPCAPESLPQGHGLVPCTGSAARRRPREDAPMFRLVRVESVQVREDAEPVFDPEMRVPFHPSGALLPIQKTLLPHRTSIRFGFTHRGAQFVPLTLLPSPDSAGKQRTA